MISDQETKLQFRLDEDQDTLFINIQTKHQGDLEYRFDYKTMEEEECMCSRGRNIPGRVKRTNALDTKQMLKGISSFLVEEVGGK